MLPSGKHATACPLPRDLTRSYSITKDHYYNYYCWCNLYASLVKEFRTESFHVCTTKRTSFEAHRDTSPQLIANKTCSVLKYWRLRVVPHSTSSSRYVSRHERPGPPTNRFQHSYACTSDTEYGGRVVAGFPSFRCISAASRTNVIIGMPITRVLYLSTYLLSMVAGSGGAAAPGEDGRADLRPAD